MTDVVVTLVIVGALVVVAMRLLDRWRAQKAERERQRLADLERKRQEEVERQRQEAADAERRRVEAEEAALQQERAKTAAERRRRVEAKAAEKRRQEEAEQAERERLIKELEAAWRRQQEEERKERERLLRLGHARAELAPMREAWKELTSATEYLSHTEFERWRFAHGVAKLPEIAHADWLPDDEAREFRHLVARLADASETVKKYNRAFVDKRMKQDRARFDALEAYPLETQQRKAIVTNEDNTLVVAGAGTGKTSTIIGRVDYLLRHGLATPEQILVLAYNRSAAQELRDRMTRLGVPEGVEIRTFHALGMSVIGQAEGRAPLLSPMQDDKRNLLLLFKATVAELLTDEAGLAAMVAFFAVHLNDDLDGDGHSSADEMIRAEKAMGLRGIDGRKLRSREEVQIANWLTLNGIPWEYERPYPHDEPTPWRRVYLPDFYLPDHDVYLEHFGIDRQFRTAPHVDNRRYIEAMQWKRDLHANHGTTLIETYSWMRQEKTLLRDLEEILAGQGVYPRPLTEEELERITAEGNQTFSDFLDLLDSFRALFQGSVMTRQEVQSKAQGPRDEAFLAIFWRVYDRYREELRRTKTIDFDDMINLAREHIRTGRYQSPFTHLVIDEFQDISENRLGLLKDLRKQQVSSRLFVVGDDWQSIYRFAGSDVGIITDLASRVGAVERVDLDVAFRYPQELLDLSSSFVMRNPNQLQKVLRANAGTAGTPPVAVVYDAGGDEEAPPVGALDAIADELILDADAEGKSVLVLGRYRAVEADAQSIKRRLEEAGFIVRVLTVHRAKGQEADYVIVAGVNAGRRGFPSEVADDPVMHMVLSAGESFPRAEERRLFYVALTRARRRVFLAASDTMPSSFVSDDLLGTELRDLVVVTGDSRPRQRCPRCGGATIVRKEGQFGIFWGCEHFPRCHGKLDSCPHCGIGPLLAPEGSYERVVRCASCGGTVQRCPKCSVGILKLKNGTNGPFWGCSMYGVSGCRYTRNH